MKREDLRKQFQCSEKETDILMQMLDLDDNGTIDSYEFMCALGMLSHGSIDDKANLIFSLYDRDKSGLLDVEEMTALIRNSLSSIKAMDGQKDRAFPADINAKVDKIFKDIDKDSNKKITLKEFKAYIKRDP